MIRRLNMTPTQFIKLSEERLRALQAKVNVQKARAEALGVREKFVQKLSLNTIDSSHEKRSFPDIDKTVNYFKNMYQSVENNENIDTPEFDNWIKNMLDYRKNINLSNQNQEIQEKLSQALKNSVPWKSPGPDGIPAAAYKILPSAKKFLNDFATKSLQGRNLIQEEDVRARMILIHKAGEISNPENYRPIAVLNTDYKLLTAAIADFIHQGLVDSMILKEQLARKNIWGTVHGLLWDKACTQAPKLSRTTNFSTWYDFSKAYDTVSHVQLQKLVAALPVHREIQNTIKAMIKKWAVVIELGKQKSSPIYVKRGVYQGDSMSPLLFVLISAFIIKSALEDKQVTRLSRGKQEVIAFMDDIKAHTPNKKQLKN